MFFECCDVKHYIRSAQKLLVLGNQQEILYTLLSGKEKITVNRTFNFISTKKPC